MKPWTAAFTLAAALAAPAAAAQTAPGQVTILRAAEAERYDPHKVVSRPMNEVMFLISDTLVALDYDLRTVRPLLATSWTTSQDGLTYTFKLRDDVTFCDGRKMTAEDVVYSFQRWTAPETRSPLANQAGKVRRVHAPDTTTVVYELQEPFADLLLQLTQTSASIVDRASVEGLGADFGVSGFNGTGPFCWVRWSPRNELVLRRNPAYRWGPSFYDNKGPAHVEHLLLRQVPDEGTRLAAMFAGQGDGTQYLPRWAIPRFEAAKTFAVVPARSYLSVLYLGFKTDRPMVSDARVRRALNLALNREDLVKSTFFGRAEPAYTYSHPASLDYNPALDATAPRYDLKAANALLDEAGWPRGPDGVRVRDGQRLAPVIVIPAPIMADAAQAVQGALRQVGVDAKLELLDGAVFFQRAAQQTFEMYGLQLPYLTAGTIVAENFVSQAIPNPNRMNWRNPEFDALIARSRSATDPSERVAASREAQLLPHRDSVWMPLVHDQAYLVLSPRMRPAKAHGIQAVVFYKGLDLQLK